MIKAKRKPKAKTKRKSKSGLKKWIADKVEPETIDFTVNRSLEECAARLKSLEKDSWWHPIVTYVSVTRVDDVAYRFQIRRIDERVRLPSLGFRENYIAANGYLRYREEGYTRLEGAIRTRFGSVTAGYKITLCLMFSLATLLIISDFSQMWFCPIVFIIAPIYLEFAHLELRYYQLVNAIKIALGHRTKQALIVPPGKARR